MCLVKQHLKRKHGNKFPKQSFSRLQNEALLYSPESAARQFPEIKLVPVQPPVIISDSESYHGNPNDNLSGRLEGRDAGMLRELTNATDLGNVFGSWECIDPIDSNTFVPSASSGPAEDTMQTRHDLADFPFCAWEVGIATDILPQLKVDDLQNSQPLTQTLASKNPIESL